MSAVLKRIGLLFIAAFAALLLFGATPASATTTPGSPANPGTHAMPGAPAGPTIVKAPPAGQAATELFATQPAKPGAVTTNAVPGQRTWLARVWSDAGYSGEAGYLYGSGGNCDGSGYTWGMGFYGNPFAWMWKISSVDVVPGNGCNAISVTGYDGQTWQTCIRPGVGIQWFGTGFNDSTELVHVWHANGCAAY